MSCNVRRSHLRSNGKVTGMRVLDTEEGPTIEGTYQAQGKLKGMEVTEMGTFSSTMRPGGALYGEDEAVVMTRDGDMASANPKGIGRFMGQGDVSWRGCALYNANETGKLPVPARNRGLVGRSNARVVAAAKEQYDYEDDKVAYSSADL